MPEISTEASVTNSTAEESSTEDLSVVSLENSTEVISEPDNGENETE